MSRGLLLALFLFSIEGAAWADDPLAQARKAIAESDYVGARADLQAARDAGGRSPEDTAELFRLTGIVDAALGDVRAATEAFTHLLALVPRASLPAGTSPKIKRPFDAAARYFKTHGPLELKIETTADPPAITLVLVSDPLGMVAKAHVVYAADGGAEQAKDVVASERTEIALPAAGRIDARVSALDDHGNHLVEIGSRDVPIVLVGKPRPALPVAPPPPPPPTHVAVLVHAAPRPVYLRWWPYAGAAVVFGAAAGYFAWSVHSDADELDRLNATSVQHPFGDARAVADRGQRDALLTNLGLGAAGAFALAAGVMYLTTPRDHVESRVTVVPVHGGGALVLGGSF
ncbi:MAG TPA: hypothetical protein VFK02_25595 [Kofleriaceae bacterium]|nr:hypothetical protein [Kofleriaceae bacterium]